MKAYDDSKTKGVLINDLLQQISKIQNSAKQIESELTRKDLSSKDIKKLRNIVRDIEFRAGNFTLSILDDLERNLESEVILKKKGLW